MDKYEYLWMCVRNNNLPADISNTKTATYSYEEIMKMDEHALIEKCNLSKKQAAYIMSTKKDRDIDKLYYEFMASPVKAVTINDEEYPDRLRYIENRPFALFYLGELPKENTKSVAIIGARNCTEYGRLMAETLGFDLAKNKINVISGMAYGVDGLAQAAALDGRRELSTEMALETSSYGVLGSGVDICYPRANRGLYNRLITEGGILSEYPILAPAKPDNFPFRNRIISGLSDIVIVVEARVKSGTFITVDYALSQGREIMVVPGRATDQLSVGCNALISQGAIPVQSADDVLRLFDTISPSAYMSKKDSMEFSCKELKHLVPKEKDKILLEREENMVYSVLDFYSSSPEDISKAVNMDIFQVMNILISLEMKGIIKETGKNLYVKCR